MAEFDSFNATEVGRFGDTTQEGLSHQFGIKINYVEKAVCRALLNIVGDQTSIRRLSYPTTPTTPISGCDEVGNYLIIYNDDLSPKDQTESVSDPIPEENQPQECEEDTDCQTVCGTCQIDAGLTKGVCVGECGSTCSTQDECGTNDCVVCDDETKTCQNKCVEVDYLESNGGQYIDTEYIPSNTTGQYAKMQYTTVNDGVTFGGMISGNGVVGPYYSRVQWWTRWGPYEPNIVTTSPTTTDTYELYLNFNNDRTAKVNDTVLSDSLGTISGSYPTLTLFRRNFSAGYAYLSGKVYKYQITEGTTLVRDFIPVLSPQIGEEERKACMFDNVSKKLFCNAGSGTFKTNLNVSN